MVIFHSKLLVYQRVQYYLYLYVNGDDWGMVGWFMVVLPTSLLEQASSIAYPSRCDRRKIIPFSEYHMNRRVKLLGHILRSNGNDPMRQISFLPDSAHRVEYGTKRVGKPRQNWLHHTKKYVYENILGHYDYGETQMNDQRVYEAAVSRQF